MKIRVGYVTNSSSSNFIIACNSPLTKKKLLKLFMVSEESFFYNRACEIADVIIENSERIDETYLYKKDLDGSIDEFVQLIGGHFLQHSTMNFVYYSYVWNEHRDIIDGAPMFFAAADIIIVNEDKWFSSGKPIPAV